MMREEKEFELKLSETQQKYDKFLNLGSDRMCTTSWTSLKDRRVQETWATFFQVDGERCEETNLEKSGKPNGSQVTTDKDEQDVELVVASDAPLCIEWLYHRWGHLKQEEVQPPETPTTPNGSFFELTSVT